MRKLFIFLLYIASYTSLFAQLQLEEEYFAVDHEKRIILCNDLRGDLQQAVSVLEFDHSYILSQPINSITKGLVLMAQYNGNAYTIYFSEVPIVKVSVSHIANINQVSELMGTIKVQDFVNPYESHAMGIRIRGASSATYPKKGYRVQIKDENLKNKDVSFFGLRSDKRWLLLAMYNERLRLNNRASHKLWMRMHRLYYGDNEPEAVASIRTNYVDLFINGSYIGVYLFTEDTDRKQLALKKTENNGEVRGQLYKGDDHGNTGFHHLPQMVGGNSEYWGGWELKYPDLEDHDWVPLFQFTHFVLNSNNSDFNNQIASKVHIDNSIDYFIFLNLLHAIDNTGKNTFFARYDTHEPYFIGVWDLDGTWGYDYTGLRNTITNALLTNRLYDRLLQNYLPYKAKLAKRWFNLRENVLSLSSLYSYIDEEYNYLVSNKVYERENLVWSLYTPSTELAYLKSWLQNRLTFLDSYFGGFVTNCNAPIINASRTQFTLGEQLTLNSMGCEGVTRWYLNGASSHVHTGESFILILAQASTLVEADCKFYTCESATKTQLVLQTNCSNQHIQHNISQSVSGEFKSVEKIESSVPLNGVNSYLSEKGIELKPGFKVESGGVFKAEVKQCE